MASKSRVLISMVTASLSAFAPQFLAYGALDLTSISYTQDFDFLSSSVSPVTWVDDQGIQNTMGSPGWYWLTTPTFYSVDDGNDPSAGRFSYGPIMGGDRAMGSITNNSNIVTVWGLVLRNLLSDPILGLEITFTGEKWREASAASDGITFSYRTSSTNITDMETAEVLPGGWTAVPALNFTTTDVVGIGPVNGNDPANRTTLTQTISVNIPVGGYFALRWYDSDASGVDHGIAIDDLTVVVAVPEAGAIFSGSVICGAAAIAAFVRRSAAIRTRFS
jgi:hypothetical protein